MLPNEIVQVEESIPSYHREDRGLWSYPIRARLSSELRLKPRTWLLLAVVVGAVLGVALLAFAKSIF
jgi:hypothetical protein